MQKRVPSTEAQDTRYPEEVVIAIAKDRDGKVNPVAISRVMIVSNEPPMLAIAIGKTRYTVETITHSRIFTVAYPSSEMKDLTRLFGTESGRDVDKLEKAGCATQPAEEIDSLILVDAVANFECELESYMPAGDHMIYVGRIVAAHINEEPKPRLYTVGPDYELGSIDLGGN